MFPSKFIRDLPSSAKRASLASLLALAFGQVGFGQVVDLAAETLDRSGRVIAEDRDSRVRRTAVARISDQYQSQVVQSPVVQTQSQVPQPTPLQPAPMQSIEGQSIQGQAPSPGQPQPLSQPQPLNLNPGAPIDDLLPPQPPPINNLNNANISPRQQASAGAVRNSFSSAPNMMGDFYGGAYSNFVGSQTVGFSQHLPGVIIMGGSGDPQAILAFEVGSDTFANDLFTGGMGMDGSGDSLADTFSLLEPIPPSDAPTSPGASFTYDGGSATYTFVASGDTPVDGTFTNGDMWLVEYSYSSTLNGTSTKVRPVPGPGVASRRVKLSENFSPDVRDRFFANYNFFNDAFGGLGDVSRYVLGMERILVDDLVSVEFRLPMAGTYSSNQDLAQAEARDFEFGNFTVISKGILLRNDRFIWSGGLGINVPTADDTVLRQNGEKLLEIRNRTVHLLPFTGLFVRKSADTTFQGYIQGDFATNGDPVFGSLTGGDLPKLGTFTDASLVHIDVAGNRVLYRNRCAPLRQVIANAELHYTGTMQDSDSVGNGTLTYENLKSNFNIVNATVGAHLLIGDKLVLSPGISVPLRDGLDEQFDYEAMVQLNYLR
ncbi:hypothetical protein K227x_28950 [Rubripirellula lacrimiformis]|uniref:Uncharacterized protein n=1 Tax=Rubripirellula lacrimiformis TaxID=1930273 RepID=A0A517NBK1_9BACT|nr:hypothetical protein [Rubripirellula lacrimiformis]QDT04503.1 hypothetical protein K227x_28950 [Rubripirellula lacrimiformis]